MTKTRLTSFLDHLTVQGRSPKTVSEYRRDLEALRSAYGREPEELTYDELMDYFAKLTQSAATKSRKMAALKSFLGFVGSPMHDRLKIPRPHCKTREGLSEAEIKALFGHLQGLPRLIIRVFLVTGLRLHELTGLNRTDYKGTYLLVRHGKGEKERCVGLDGHTREEINTYLASRMDQDPALFTSAWGRRISGTTVARLLNNAAVAAGIPKKVHPHLLRHSFATRSILAKQPLQFVQETLGHSDIRVTSLYTHIPMEEKLRIVEETAKTLPI